MVAIPHMERSQYARHPCYAAFGLEAYIGDVVLVDGVRYGTVNFSSPSPLDTAFALFDQYASVSRRVLPGALFRLIRLVFSRTSCLFNSIQLLGYPPPSPFLP